MSNDNVLFILLGGAAVVGLTAYILHRIGSPLFGKAAFLAVALFATSTIFMK